VPKASVGRTWSPAGWRRAGLAQTVVRVDVTDEFPFLVTKLSPYYDR
jgi:hypothetical protein